MPRFLKSMKKQLKKTQRKKEKCQKQLERNLKQVVKDELSLAFIKKGQKITTPTPRQIPTVKRA